jgi:serine/threonine-protein kinase
MSSGADRWRRVEELCQAALERDVGERSAFLAASCEDDELRREVESLLAREPQADRFLDQHARELMVRNMERGSREWIIGRRIGVYEVVGHLGAGGMGEVYRARDTKLGREVAVKVLAPIFKADRERLDRFEREARVLAALNHPNIGAIYGVEDSEGVPALVMELVEGPTLADRIAQGALPLDEVLPIAKQISEALEAAHDSGIIHRDLKPANVKVRADGTVKVLDFGLSKVLEPTNSTATNTMLSPTQSPHATQAGVILGTAPYMAPEQARGRPVDQRADIWAFGAVLFEMLTGVRAFDGADVSITLAAVLKTDPDWRALPPATPAGLRRLLTRCLEKEPKERLQSIGDARIELRDLSRDAVDAPGEPQRTISRHAAVLGAGTLLLGVALGGTVVRLLTRSAAPAVTRTMIATSPTASATISGYTTDVAVSPDGARVVYVGNGSTQIFVRALDRLEPVALATGHNVRNPFVSPDGRWVGFFDGLALKKVPMSGGAAITLFEPIQGTSPCGATWATDDSIVIATSSVASGLWLIPARGGEPTQLTQPDRARGEAQHLWPERLPGGQTVLFTITSQTGGPDAAQIAVLDLRTRVRNILLHGGSHAQYVASGHLVYSASRTLRAVRFDLRRLEVQGTGLEVVPRLLTSPQGDADFSAAGDTLVYVDAPDTAVSDPKRTVTWVDRTGREQPIATPPLSYIYPRLSPDETRLVLDISGQDRGLWIWDFQRATLTRLTIDLALNRVPEWTRDGKRIVYSSNRDGFDNLWWQAADGTGIPERLTTSRNVQLASGSTPDGRAMIFFESRPSTLQDVMQLSLDGSRRVTPLLQSPFLERNGVISPDGRWIAYESDSSGQMQVYVRPFPDTNGGQWQVSTEGGTRPLWSRNGSELFYVAPTPGAPLMRVPLETSGATFHALPPVKLFEGYAAMNPSRTYDVAADGRFVMIKPAAANEAEQASLIIVQHWGEELKRLVSK